MFSELFVAIYYIYGSPSNRRGIARVTSKYIFTLCKGIANSMQARLLILVIGDKVMNKPSSLATNNNLA